MEPVCGAPLLVTFTEFSRRSCKARQSPAKTILLVGLCGAAGALCRWGLTIPLAIAAATAAALLLMKGIRQYLPPAGVMEILPMLLPVQALIGISALMGMTLLFLIHKKNS